MDKQIVFYLRVIVGWLICFCVLILIFGIVLIAKVERMTKVAESLNNKIESTMTAAAPLGHVAVDKGVAIMQNIDANDLGKSATEGVKGIGLSLKAKADAWLDNPHLPTSRPSQP